MQFLVLGNIRAGITFFNVTKFEMNVQCVSTFNIGLIHSNVVSPFDISRKWGHRICPAANCAQ